MLNGDSTTAYGCACFAPPERAGGNASGFNTSICDATGEEELELLLSLHALIKRIHQPVFYTFQPFEAFRSLTRFRVVAFRTGEVDIIVLYFPRLNLRPVSEAR